MEVSNSYKWKVAKKNEMDELQRSKTWDLMEIPKDKKVVSWKWVYKLKKQFDDTIQNYKLRLVAKGYS